MCENDLIIHTFCTTLRITIYAFRDDYDRYPSPCRARRISARTEHYGRSLLGAPLIWFPAPATDRDSGLILAGTHGDENASIVTLSCALRTLTPSLRRHHVVLAVNPDGCQLGLRANANGVDLNRNFPAANWKAGETVYRWNSSAEQRDVVLLTGIIRSGTGNPGAVSVDSPHSSRTGGLISRPAGMH